MRSCVVVLNEIFCKQVLSRVFIAYSSLECCMLIIENKDVLRDRGEKTSKISCA